MNRPKMMTGLADRAVKLPKDDLYRLVFEMAKWIPDMGLFTLTEDTIPEATRQPSHISVEQALYEDGEL